MMFYVGQKVSQIKPWSDPDDTGYPGVRLSSCGVIYTIREILILKGVEALRFIELRNPVKAYREFGFLEQPFPSWNFRPVVERKTDISIFTALLNTDNAKENA